MLKYAHISRANSTISGAQWNLTFCMSAYTKMCSQCCETNYPKNHTVNKLNVSVIWKISLFTNATNKFWSLVMTGLADVKGFKLFTQVSVWLRIPPLYKGESIMPKRWKNPSVQLHLLKELSATKRWSAGVAPKVNLRIPFHTGMKHLYFETQRKRDQKSKTGVLVKIFERNLRIREMAPRRFSVTKVTLLV